MAKVRVWPGRRPASFLSGIYYRVLGGQLVAQSKPRPRGRAGSPKQLENQARFADAARAVKYMDANQQWVARKMSEHQPQQPGDLLMQAMLGTMGPIHFEDGRVLYSVSERDEVSQALDLIARFHGDMIIRGPELWQFLGPGTPGDVLTTRGPGAAPHWAPGAAGQFTYLSTSFQGQVRSSSPQASKGHKFTPIQRIILRQFWAHTIQTTGRRYRITIVRLDGLLIDAILAQTPEYTAITSGWIAQPFTLAADLSIDPGTQIAILHSRTDGLDTDASDITVKSGFLYLPPSEPQPWLTVLAKKVPAIGDQLPNNTQTSYYAINMAYGV